MPKRKPFELARISSGIALASSAAFVVWMAVRFAAVADEAKLLNPGKKTFFEFPTGEFVGLGAALGLGLLLYLRREFAFAAMLAIGAAIFVGISWIGMNY